MVQNGNIRLLLTKQELTTAMIMIHKIATVYVNSEDSKLLNFK